MSNVALPADSPRNQSGYIAVVTAIIMTLLLVAVGLAVDIAMWYSRSTQIQRAADAAALAGVTAGPVLATEIEQAKQSLARNGFVDGVGGITTKVELQDGYTNRLNVIIQDQNVGGYFSRVFREPPSIERQATAEYVKDISLGSAFNAIGTGNIQGHVPGVAATTTQGFWLSVSGSCTNKEDGDRLLAYADGGRELNGWRYACTKDSYWPTTDSAGRPGHPDLVNGFANSHTNEDYDPAGYAYIVSVPCPGIADDELCPGSTNLTNNPVAIEIYDPAYAPNAGATDPTAATDLRIDRKAVANSQHWAWNDSRVTTTYSLYAPDDTPDDPLDDVLLAKQFFETCLDTVPASPCPGKLDWYTLFNIPVGSRGGKYRVQVHTEANQWEGFGHNMFALRARVGGGPWFPCSTIATSPAYFDGCPSVSGEESMSVYANSAGASSDLFLARLAPASQYRGKRVRILLWDPGEGAQSIQILPPGSMTPAQFRYRTWDPGLRQTTGANDLIQDRAEGWNTVLKTDTLDVSGTTPVAGTFNGIAYPSWNVNSRYSSFKYNDRMVAIEISVPNDYGRDASGNPIPLPDDGWWKIRYNTNTGVVQDRSTWTVTLAGDPVHLIDPAIK